MLSSISPVGEATRANRWSLTAVAHLLGSLAGGVVAGAALGAAGRAMTAVPGVRLPVSWALGALAVLAAAGAAADRGWAGLSLPSRHRQVDERWLTTYRGWVYGAGFGFQLGLGLTTVVTASATYLALLVALLTTSPADGALVGATFGAVRALPLLATARVRTPASLRALHRRLDAADRPVARLTSGAQLTVAGVAALAALGGP